MRTHVYEPLKRSRPNLRIFFDVDALGGGVDWFVRLATAVGECRLFVAAYCPEYFASDFCQWELQLALVRDPIGRKGLVAPILVDKVELPAYCSLIQATEATRADFDRQLVEMVNRALG